VDSLRVEGLGKRYYIGARKPRELWALRDVSFETPQRTILGIIGPNGAGKTTLLKVLSRITPPTEGRVHGFGRVVPLLALGSTFQPDLSGRDNIFLSAATYGLPAADVEKRFDEIVEFSGVGEFIDVPVKRYSSGMNLRLAFSVAVNMQPDILLADEILAVGDAEFQERCLDRVAAAGRAGMLVLFVSHDMAAITRLCDQVLWLNAGEIVKIGPPGEVVAEYQSASWTQTIRRLKGSRGDPHRNQFGEILFVTMTSPEGQEIGAVRTNDDAVVKIGMRFDSAGFKVRYTLHVRALGTLVFRARPREDYRVDQPGFYTVTARIPSKVLAPLVYTLSVDATVFRGDDFFPTGDEYYPMSAHNVLSFQVFDVSSNQRDHLGGLVAPALEWQTHYEAGVGAAADSGRTNG
jgi:lipopolysaccharide transport system ATP-binding protein